MSASDDVPPTTITELAYGVFPSLATLAGMQLDLFSHVSGGATTPHTIARALDVDPNKLIPLLDLLVTSGLLTRRGEHLENSEEAERYLVRGRPDCRLELAAFYEGLWRAGMMSAQSLRGGRPASRIDFVCPRCPAQRPPVAAARR